MKTEDSQYSQYLENKYLPGRSLYLSRIFYPKLFRAFRTPDPIIDLGCGTGEFLKYCRRKKREAIGVDSNEELARKCRNKGLDVLKDSICELTSLKGRQFKYAICDNVLEHLGLEALNRFFERMDSLLLSEGTLTCIVPGIRGFETDPTHKTFISESVLSNLLSKRALRITNYYFHPFNFRNLDRYFYLNMQVFEISTTSAAGKTLLHTLSNSAPVRQAVESDRQSLQQVSDKVSGRFS